MNEKKTLFLAMLLILLFRMGALADCKEEILQYPALYGKELPRYANARLVDTGRSTDSLQDGLKLQLVSPDPVLKIAEYYAAELVKLGWTPPEKKRYRNPGIYIGRFTKGDLFFLLRVSRLSPHQKESKIEISYAMD